MTPAELRAIREALDLTQAELAAALGLVGGRNVIYRMEAGRRVVTERTALQVMELARRKKQPSRNP